MVQILFKEAPKYIKNVRNPEKRHWVQFIKKLCDDLHWDNSYHDYDIWRRGFPTKDFALWMAIDERKDMPVASVTMCNHRNTNNPGQAPLGCMSMYYMLPEYKGLNIGWNLFINCWNECLDNKLYYGSDYMYKKYADIYGVNLDPGWEMEEYMFDCSKVNPLKLPYDEEIVVKDYGDINPGDLLKYDRKMTAGINRDNYLLAAINHPDQVCKVTMCEETGKMTGICRIREIIGDMLSFGPFYADTPLIASTLARAAILALDPKPYTRFVMKTCSTNENAKRLTFDLMDGQEYGFQVFHPRFGKEILHFPTDLIYSLTELNCNII